MDSQAQFHQAVALNRQNRLAEAETLYRQLLAEKPDHFDALHLLGVILFQTGRVAEGIEIVGRALAIEPDNADLHNNLGNGFAAAGQHDEAITSYSRAIELNPFFIEAYQNRIKALEVLQDFSAALADYDRLVALQPHAAEAVYSRGNALSRMRRFEEALGDYNQALALNPDSIDAHINRGNALRELRRLDEAIACYGRVIARNPGHADAHFNQSQCLLLAGRWAEGWPLYEWRKKRAEPIAATVYDQPLWTGAQDIAGKILFVYCEQGLGDTIQFCRYVTLVQARGARVVLAAPRGLWHLLQTLKPAPELIEQDTAPHAFDFHIPLMSLPLAFATTPDNVPAPARYLSADPVLVKKWRAHLGTGRFKIGVSWQGKDNPVLYGRSFPLTALAGLAKIPNLRLISLQKGDGVEQLRHLPPDMKVEDPGAAFDAGDNAFADTAAIIENLDLVITLDSAIAHLSGALGRPTWVALKQVPDWRWLLTGDRSAWYPAMRLFRQQRREDWTSVFEEMEKELRK